MERLTADALLEHEGFVRSLARRLLVDEHDAADLVQETWLRALRGLSPTGAQGHRSARRWLAVVASRLASNRRRTEEHDGSEGRYRGFKPVTCRHVGVSMGYDAVIVARSPSQRPRLRAGWGPSLGRRRWR